MSLTSVDSGPLHVKPRVDLNIATEANRILYVMNKVINRVKFAARMKRLTEDDGHLLDDILDEPTRLNVINACQNYMVVTDKMTNFNTTFLESKKSSTDTAATNSPDDSSSMGSSDYSDGEDLAVKEIKKIFYMLEEKPEVQKIVKTIKEQSPQMRFLIQCLTEFKNLMEVHLNESAAQYKAKENYLREVYNKNEKAKEEIEKLEEALVVTKTDANVCLIGKNILIKRHQNKIEKIKRNSLEAIEKRVNESESTMVNDWKNSMEQQELLKNDFNQASEKYSNALRDHLAAEKVLRAKRTKLENQVLGWIQKYDQDIGEKQAEEEEIQARLDQEIQEVNEIQKKLDDQAEEYDELMQEKADYEEEVLERRLYQFIVNRSARRIQKSYRMYKARKLVKKLARKSKKSKKKE